MKKLLWIILHCLVLIQGRGSIADVKKSKLELLASSMGRSGAPPPKDLEQLMEAELSESSPGVMAAIYSWLGSLFESNNNSSSSSSIRRVDDLIREKWSAGNRKLANLTSSMRITQQPLSNLINPELELLDEVNDREIFRAVLNSLAEWNLNKEKRKKHNRRKRDEEVVCYPDVGCFRDEGPFDYLDLLPSPPEEINTRFYLYTERNMDVPYVMYYNNVTSILSSPFNASHATKIIVHGFGSSCHRVWAREMRLALMSVGGVNVICVDWENGASLPNYVRAAVNTRLVGKQVALLVSALNNLTSTNNTNFHLIGFSLGAHVAGFAGSELRNVSRITGLDPAGPLFENYDPRARLDSSDADLVDVIHSNGESLIMGGLGAWAPMGHMDFYPNGGRMQKGCSNLFIGAVSDIIWSPPEENGRSLCNHRRAYKFFTDSVIPGCHFPAFACESYEKLLEGDCFPCADLKQCANMGYFADKSNGRGVLYLATREEEPFCANQYRVQLHSTPSRQPFYTHGKIEIVLSANDVNETFSLTKGPDEELHSGGRLLRLIVAHPSLKPPPKVRITYTAYNGWLSSGLSYWSVDKIVMMDSFGNSVSFCQRGLVLQSGVPVLLSLLPGDCNVLSTSTLDNGVPWQPVDALYPFPEGETPAGADPLLSSNALRSLRDPTNGTIDKMSPYSGSFLAQQPSNLTSSVFPYGNVPLSVLQQHADIKVATRKPSFYQWPFVSAGQVKAKLKSLGGIRKPEPHSQLIPPQPAPNSRRSYFRRNSRQRNRNNNPPLQAIQLQPPQQSPQLYSPLYPQVLPNQVPMPVDHLQQTFAYSLLNQNSPALASTTSNRNLVSSIASPASQSSFINTPILQYLPVTNQNVSSVTVSTPTVPLVTISTTTIEPAVHVKAIEVGDLTESESIQTFYQKANNEPELILTGVEAPLLVTGKTPGPRDPPAKNVTSQGQVISGTTEPVSETTTTPPATEQPSIIRLEGALLRQPQVSVEIVPVDTAVASLPPAIKEQEPYGNFDNNKDPLPVSFPMVITSKEPVSDTRKRPNIKSQLNRDTSPVEPLPSPELKVGGPTSESVQQHDQDPSIKKEPVLPLVIDDIETGRAFQNSPMPNPAAILNPMSQPNPYQYPFSWSYFTDNERVPYVRYTFGNGDVNLALQPEDVFPNPAQLGQARDQYWSRARMTPAIVPPWMTGAAIEVKQPQQQQQQPRYIPLNPVDRQSRMMQPQYYVESPAAPVAASRSARYSEYVVYPSMRS